MYKEQTCLRCTNVLVAVAASSKEENHSRKYSAAPASPRRFLPRPGFAFILQAFLFSHALFWHIYKFHPGVRLSFLFRRRLSAFAPVCAAARVSLSIYYLYFALTHLRIFSSNFLFLFNLFSLSNYSTAILTYLVYVCQFDPRSSFFEHYFYINIYFYPYFGYGHPPRRYISSNNFSLYF